MKRLNLFVTYYFPIRLEVSTIAQIVFSIILLGQDSGLAMVDSGKIQLTVPIFQTVNPKGYISKS